MKQRFVVEMDTSLAAMLKNSGQMRIVEFLDDGWNEGGGPGKRVRVFDIQWDTDGEDVDLPSEVELSFEDGELLDSDGSSIDVEELIADKLSDEYGWTVSSFDYERLN
jgi:hypothetical protein